jgi:hypothetical protein
MLLQKSAEQGNAIGEFDLGSMYWGGEEFRKITQRQQNGFCWQPSRDTPKQNLRWKTCTELD